MKVRTVVTIVGLAIGFALPGLTQEQNAVDPELRQQIEAVTKRRRRRIINMTRPLGLPFTHKALSTSGRGSQMVRLSVCRL